MTRLLLVGATGLVGAEVLRQALLDSRITKVVAPTRRPLSPQSKLFNPVVDFDHLPTEAEWWACDAVVCALGTTIKDAGSQEAFRRVDHDYPLWVAQSARRHGARNYVLVSATGADPASRIFYSRTKGELERDLRSEDFESLTLVRPGLLGGERARRRALESLAMKLLSGLGPLVPGRYRLVPAGALAATLIAAALSGPRGVTIIESEAIGAV